MSKKIVKDEYNTTGSKNNNSDPVNGKLVTDKAIVVIGSVDAGKSSLIGVLSTDVLDDGRGLSRASVARHKHEIETGRTSDISSRIIRFPNGKSITIFDTCGHQTYMHSTAYGIASTWADYGITVVSPARGILPITRQYFKMIMSYNIPSMIVVTHVDMCQEDSCKIVDRDINTLCKQYKRNTVFLNDYNKYHSYKRGFNLVSNLNIDNGNLSDDDIKKHNISENDITDINEYFNFDTTKMTMVREINQGLNMAGGRQNYIPIIYVSNVDGYCLDVVKQAMMTVEPRDLWSKDENASSIVKFFRTKLNLPNLGMNDPHIGSTFYIDHAYNVKGVGLVISGINRGERINVNDELYLGPINKEFIKIKLRSIHNDDRTPIEYLDNHHRGCIAIKSLKEEIKKSQIAKGTVLISSLEMNKNVCFRFEAAVTIFGHHSATLRTGYSPVLHIGTIRQTGKLILPEITLTNEEKNLTDIKEKDPFEKKDKPHHKLKSGDVAQVDFKFSFRPEYLDPGTVFCFRSGEMHGVGCVIKVITLDKDPDAQPEPLKKKFRRIRPSNRPQDQNAKKTEKVIVNPNP